MKPLPAAEALDRYFLEARSRLLDLAAILDRIDRGEGGVPAGQDPRMARIHEALDVLHVLPKDRAERIQQLFSLAYDPNWKRPEPR
ncbi:hypothetical protein [Limnoglobus roseus]|uniref:Uncharacterized protein n=1 Tax=Limnoglobus roseus TaxID=2598579 RepID=A0A5C1ALB7_9BACT|nr:hypothetical protein [Limnoglobus roseus]QEL17984.1 hypothetical protein PX52LOC_04998 [Limnoglobus roseus]